MKVSGSNDCLQRVFGHDTLRPGQAEVIERVLAGVNTLAVLPTGGGKSLCYQYPALVLAGLTVVVSPLIALMRDQVDSLQAKGVAVRRWDSSLTEGELAALGDELVSGRVNVLYVSPERLGSEPLLSVLKSQEIAFIAIDEAHCVSEWGHSFRPAYITLSKTVRRLKAKSVLALTATASPQVAREIRKAFGILKRDQVQTSFFRENLHFCIHACLDTEKSAVLLGRLSDAARLPAIVYATRRETVETLAAFLRRNGVDARAYHAGMHSAARSEVQDGFVAGDFPVICATIAFGMGVDMPGVRAVLHYQPPKSPEGWIQESGRAGRDGGVSHCELLLSGNDREMLESFTVAQRVTRHSLSRIISSLFSQGRRVVLSRYDLTSLHDISWEQLDILLARLEMGGWIEPEQGSWLWCHAVPLVPVDQVLDGFKPSDRKWLRPLLESRQRVSLMEISGGGAAGQLKLMGVLAELNASQDVRMHFSHSLHHYRVRKQPGELLDLIDSMLEVFEHHAEQGLKRIDAVFKVATSSRCITAGLLSHFGEKLSDGCGCCSSCRGEKRVRKLPYRQVEGVRPEELETIQALIRERKPALSGAERLARFLCGIYSPGMMRYRLYRRDEWGMLSRLPFDDVLACARVQLG